MEWVDVNDELPKKDGFYNVEIETDERNIIHSCWFENGKWKYDNYLIAGEPLFATSWYASVLFWQPLPKKRNE